MKSLRKSTGRTFAPQRPRLNGVNVFDELEKRGLEPYESGDNFVMALCPFHDDQSPSLSVHTGTGSVQCFGCGTRGDIADVVAEVDGVTRAEALTVFYRDESVGDIVSDVYKFLSTGQEDCKSFDRAAFDRAFPSVSKYSVAVKYLENRGITGDSIKRFHIRYAPKGKMAGRVVLPIRSDKGRIVSYVGRTIRGETPKTRKQGSKGSTLYGIHELQKIGQIWPYLVVVEGEFDAVYLQQFSIPAVAAMGSGELTKEQRILLKRYAKKVVLAYDGDDAGEKAVYGSKGNFYSLSRYMPTIPLSLPEGKDPNSLSETEVYELFEPYRADFGGSYE